MKIAVFSDIHGNYVNLDHFFEVSEKLSIQKYICLGDLCNYYPDSIKVVSKLKEANVTCLKGNHDEMYLTDTNLSNQKKAAYNYNESLKGNNLFINYIKSLPETFELSLNGKRSLFCHASPADPLNEYVFPDSDLSKFNHLNFDLVFMGHTHRQFLKTINGKVFCNVGSIGQPRDKGNLFGFALIDTDDLKINLIRVESDIGKIKQQYIHNTPKEVLAMMDRNENLNFEFTLLK